MTKSLKGRRIFSFMESNADELERQRQTGEINQSNCWAFFDKIFIGVNENEYSVSSRHCAGYTERVKLSPHKAVCEGERERVLDDMCSVAL